MHWAHAEYVQPMREEVEAIISAEGWTKSAVGKFRKLDSFLRESQRVSGNGVCMYCVPYGCCNVF